MPVAYVAVPDSVGVVRGERPVADPAPGETLAGWTVDWHQDGRDFQCLDASPAAPAQVFAGTAASGLLRSTDAGRKWAALGHFEVPVTAVTVSPHDPDVVWVGTEPSAIYRSTDGGDTWERSEGLRDLPSESRWSYPPRPGTDHVRWIAVHPTDPGTLYVAIEAGALVRTFDAGETWVDHPEDAPRDSHTLATHPAEPDRVYSAAGDGYAESPDCGDSWTFTEAGLDHGYVWGLAVDTADPETVTVSAADGARTAHRPASAESHVYRRSGSQWQSAMRGLPPAEGTVRPELAAGDAGEFFAVTNRGIFRSADAARSWHRLGVAWREQADAIPWGLAVVG